MSHEKLQLEFKNICLNFGAKEIFKDINLTLNRGDFVAIVGPNGAGKSSFLNLFTKHRPCSGKLLINHQNFYSKYHQSRVAHVLQDSKLATVLDFSVRENLHLALLKNKKLSLKSATVEVSHINNLLKSLDMNLENHLDTPVGHLSGGQRQALSLVMSTLTPYDILLLDEFTANLDPSTGDHLMNLVLKIKNRSIGFMVTHNLEHAFKADSILLIRDRGASWVKCASTPELYQKLI